MALTFIPATLTIESTASITDLPLFHAELRDWEDSEAAAIYPVTHSWKSLDLGGASFNQLDLLNGWVLRFPSAGAYVISGNLNGTVTLAAGASVERKTSAAYITTASGGSGPTAASIAAAVRAELANELAKLDVAISTRHPTNTLIDANVKQMNSIPVIGNGSESDKWRSPHV